MLSTRPERAPVEAALPCRVMLLIPSLEAGGAERQLIVLAKALCEWGMRVTIVTFYPGGRFSGELAMFPDIEIVSLGKRTGMRGLPTLVLRLWRRVRADRPDVVHGYMGEGPNELALLVGRLSGARVVWGLRASNVDTALYGRLHTAIFRLGAILSRWPDLVIVNSEAGRRHHLANGYRGDRMLVIHNGIDTERFCPNPAAGVALRRAWGIASDSEVIGLVARIDPMKDHANFLAAAALLVRRRPKARFVCVGGGPDAQREALLSRSRALGIQQHVLWIAERTDLELVYNAFDLATSASAFGEGFSNALGEAMSCGLPCVATDVGDASIIIGATGAIVQPRRPIDLADAWERMLSIEPAARKVLSDAARARMVDRFSLSVFARRSIAALAALSGAPEASRALVTDGAAFKTGTP